MECFLWNSSNSWGHRNESDTVPVPKLTVRVEEETNKCLVMCHRSSIFVD